jgi:hypothetical protein
MGVWRGVKLPRAIRSVGPAAWLTFAIVCAWSTASAQESNVAGDYATWIRPYEKRPLEAGLAFGKEPSPPSKLIITAIEGDEPRPPDPPGVFHVGRSDFRYGCRVSIDGRVSYFSIGAMDSKGSGYNQIPDADQKRLDGLLASLPNDYSRLPPPNRRLVVQASIGKQEITRVYDRANAPDQVLEILRLTQSQIPSWVLSFEPESHWSAQARSTFGALAQSAGGLIVSGGDDGPFKFWDPDTRGLLTEVPNTTFVIDQMEMPHTTRGLAFSPSGFVAAVEGLGFIDVRDAALAHRIGVLAEPLVGESQESVVKSSVHRRWKVSHCAK